MKRTTAVRIALCSLFTALITMDVFPQAPLPNFDYFTLQFFFALMVGVLLGAHLGTLSAALYVLIDLLGMPMFAAGGGISYALRSSFGFLPGFTVIAFRSSQVMRHRQRKWKTCFLTVLAGLLATCGIELAYKYMILDYCTGTGISFPLLPLSYFPLDLPEDILCGILAAYVALRFPMAVYRGIKQERVYARQIQK